MSFDLFTMSRVQGARVTLVAIQFAAFLATVNGLSCEDDWVQYKDKLSFKIFTNLETYEDAKKFCSSQGNAAFNASLVTVKDEELQDLLLKYAKDIHDNIWLGGRYDNESSKFKWDDGDALVYNNWQRGYPKEITDANVCIEMSSTVTWIWSLATIKGTWVHVPCQKRNRVVCQRKISWSFQDTANEIIKIKTQLQDMNAAVENMKNDNALTFRLHEHVKNQVVNVREQMQVVKATVVPVGYVYVEYYNQSSPSKLWPSLTWKDVTSTYAGLFFRALGGGSVAWGAIQNGCSPRVTQMRHVERTQSTYSNPINIPPGGWSEAGDVGENHNYYAIPGNTYFEGLEFYTKNCEIRPKNQAIRIWKRIA